MNHRWYEWSKSIEGLPPGCLGIIAAFIVPILVAIGIWLYSEDTIQFMNSMEEKGALVDGRLYAPLENDYPIPLVAAGINSVTIGNFIPGMSPGEKGEVVAFTKGKPPFLSTDVPWSFMSDTVLVDFHNQQYPISVKIWILTTAWYSFSEQRWRILTTHCSPEALNIWSQEGQGVQIACDDPMDATNVTLTFDDGSTAVTNSYFSGRDFYCDDHGSVLQGSAAYTRGVLNVYYVPYVYGELGELGSDYGVWCTGGQSDVIVMGLDTFVGGEGLLAHEFGHAFMALGDEAHVDNVSDNLSVPPCGSTPCSPPPSPFMCGAIRCQFDRLNVMHGASSLRQSLTEGQVFRAFFNKDSAINSLYGGQGGGLNRVCGGGSPFTATDNFECLPVQKRIWPDNGEYGPWPVN